MQLHKDKTLLSWTACFTTYVYYKEAKITVFNIRYGTAKESFRADIFIYIQQFTSYISLQSLLLIFSHLPHM